MSRFCSDDAIFVFSVGGGSRTKNVSVNLVECVEMAQRIGATIFGVVGKDGGITAEASRHVVVVPSVNQDYVTPHVEGWQAVVWHALVSHPAVQSNEMKWESIR